MSSSGTSRSATVIERTTTLSTLNIQEALHIYEDTADREIGNQRSHISALDMPPDEHCS
jgi:hypothetical protein